MRAVTRDPLVMLCLQKQIVRIAFCNIDIGDSKLFFSQSSSRVTHAVRFESTWSALGRENGLGCSSVCTKSLNAGQRTTLYCRSISSGTLLTKSQAGSANSFRPRQFVFLSFFLMLGDVGKIAKLGVDADMYRVISEVQKLTRNGNCFWSHICSKLGPARYKKHTSRRANLHSR